MLQQNLKGRFEGPGGKCVFHQQRNTCVFNREILMSSIEKYLCETKKSLDSLMNQPELYHSMLPLLDLIEDEF